MNRDPEVSAWLDDLDHPLMEVIQAVRTQFLEADERITADPDYSKVEADGDR